MDDTPEQKMVMGILKAWDQQKPKCNTQVFLNACGLCMVKVFQAAKLSRQEFVEMCAEMFDTNWTETPADMQEVLEKLDLA